MRFDMLLLDFSSYLQTVALGFICHFQFPFRHNVTAEREGVVWFKIQGEVGPQFRVREADLWSTQVVLLFLYSWI